MSFNDIENLLREKLGPGSSRPLPSHGFEERVHGSLTSRRAGGRRRAHALEALVGLAAVAALLAVAVPWLTGPRPGGAQGGAPKGVGNAAVPKPAPTQTPVPLAHAQKWFLAFDYPAAWTLADQNVLSQDALGTTKGLRFLPGDSMEVAGRSVGFVGSGSAKDICVGDLTDPSVQVDCTTQWTLPGGSVQVRFWVASGAKWDGLSAIDGYPLGGYTSTTVDGLPAMFSKTTGSISNAALFRPTQSVPDADEVLSWVLPTQRELEGAYSIDAVIRGPNIAGLESQVRAMIASLRWEPAAYRLPTDPAALDAAQAAAITSGLSSLRSQPNSQILTGNYPHFFDCFPSKTEASVPATISHSQQAPLTQRLPVICTTAIKPNSMQGWTLSLTQKWVAGPDYPAGYCTNVYQLNLDGTLAQFDQTAPDYSKHVIYPHQGSNGPG